MEHGWKIHRYAMILMRGRHFNRSADLFAMCSHLYVVLTMRPRARAGVTVPDETLCFRVGDYTHDSYMKRNNSDFQSCVRNFPFLEVGAARA